LIFIKSIKPIGGENIVVEIDETNIGKNKYHVDHLIKGFWVLGMVECKIIVIHAEKER
jgi:hypothetical protein